MSRHHLLGLSLNHDSSASIHNPDGYLVAALQEERVSRKKNHYGIPRLAIGELLTHKDIADGSALEVVIGSHSNLREQEGYAMLARLQENPSNKEGIFYDLAPYLHPGFQKKEDLPIKLQIETKIRQIISDLQREFQLRFHWENHHDSHLGCTLANTIGDSKNLLISLDGAGDGESGAIAIGSAKSGIRSLSRFSSLDSLGLLYSAVTGRYNFRPTVHEGKITGLAAYGSDEQLVKLLLEFIDVVDGVPNLKYQKTPFSIAQKIVRTLYTSLSLDKSKIQKPYVSIGQFVDNIALTCKSYPDLAHAVQSALEISIGRIVDYWVNMTGIRNLSLAGGVFSNVKLNQSIAELNSVHAVNIFPNMGDGGISAGGVWSYLSKQGRLAPTSLYSDMYLGPIALDSEIDIARSDHSFKVREIIPSVTPRVIAQDVAVGKMVGLHFGAMEFGPRALGNRTLLLDPRDHNVKASANQRLGRTEFMPFAPIVTKEYFDLYFETLNNSLQPFYFMTMTCKVRDEFRAILPGITHVDGTARPQIVSSQSNKRVYDILNEFGKHTGLYVLINTSLNIHEEPINYSLNDSLSALKADAFDVLYHGNFVITLLDEANRKTK